MVPSLESKPEKYCISLSLLFFLLKKKNMFLHAFVFAVCLANVTARSISDDEYDGIKYNSLGENLRSVTHPNYIVENAGSCKDDSECKNGGTCQEKNSVMTCLCLEGTEGPFCEKSPEKVPFLECVFPPCVKIPECETKICEDGSECVFDTTKGSAVCKCSSEASIYDEIEKLCKDPCFPNPCRNGGMCKTRGGETLCFCLATFTGKFCEMDPCTTNPCMNDGLCKINGTTFRCDCHQPFSGRLCERDPCTWNPCKNGGICKIENNAAKCFCKEPFTGEFCESRTDPCMWYPCKNGGICKFENNAAKCYCKEPFTGEFCDSRTEIDSTFIIFAVTTSLLVVVLVFISGMLCRRIHVVKSN